MSESFMGMAILIKLDMLTKQIKNNFGKKLHSKNLHGMINSLSK